MYYFPNSNLKYFTFFGEHMITKRWRKKKEKVLPVIYCHSWQFAHVQKKMKLSCVPWVCANSSFEKPHIFALNGPSKTQSFSMFCNWLMLKTWVTFRIVIFYKAGDILLEEKFISRGK